ncbi:MAG: ribulokinase [Candidatus Limnocylindrales bacterium]
MTGMRTAIGVDFGSESARAVLVDVATGREIAAAVSPFAHGVIEEALPDGGAPLPADWALQDPDDYVASMGATVREVLRTSGVDPADVVGVGIDFTACTMLPTTADGTPLCRLPELRSEPHAWVKLWKHHAAQPEADRINAIAAERGEPWLPRYGGRTSSEWFLAKSLQILDESPGVYAAADRLIEAADWIVWQLTGVETRNSCTAGYKAQWSRREGFPSAEYLGALDPRFADLVDSRMSRDVRAIGERAGVVSSDAAQWTGLRPGTPVAIANVDAHVSVPACGVTTPGTLVAVMGTSTCHLVLSADERVVPGACGVVEDGIIPGLFGHEAGQASVGDLFGWWARQVAGTTDLGRVHADLETAAAAKRPGETGLVALDWWNGNRSVLVDADLTGLLLGATLATNPGDVYRAFLEATVFGTRVIIEAFEAAGVAVDDIVAGGGLPYQNRLLMQLTADITGREVRIAGTNQAGALGSAMFGAVAAGAAAGGYDTITDAAARMAHLAPDVYRPATGDRGAWDEAYGLYRELHDTMARQDSVMRRLRALQARTRAEVGGPR